MGALANAAALMDSPVWRGLVKAAAIYQASKVMEEDVNVANHAKRRQLAEEVLNNPQLILDRLSAILAGTPSIATLSADPTQIPDNNIIQRTEQVWTNLAQIYYGV